MRTVIGHGLRAASYGLFLGLYIYAAAAYGLTREQPLRAFEWGMGGAFGLWLLAHVFLGRPPSTGILPWLATGAVLAFAWFVTGVGAINEAIIDERLEGWDDWFPSSLLLNWSSQDPPLSIAASVRTTALLAAMLMAIDLWRSPRWARALVITMIFSSLGMVLFFLLQRVFGSPFLLDDIFHKATLAFGTYRYWGNAASYLNLFWPISAAIALFAAIRQSYGWPLWLIPASITFAANFLNLSKAGNVLAVIGAGLLLALVVPMWLREMKRSRRQFRRSYLIGALIPILLIAASLPFAVPWERWEYLAQSANSGEVNRPKAYARFVRMLPSSGWVGFGPGTFQSSYRPYVIDDPQLERTPFWVAHQDYLQTAVEWGFIGVLLWTFTLLPPCVALLFRACRPPAARPRETEEYRITLADHFAAFFKTLPPPGDPCFAAGAFVAVLLTALHSLVDFPMQIASLQLYFLVLVALGWSYLSSRPADRPGPVE